MSGGLPPVPALIPISGFVRRCTSSEVMGEQRSRRSSTKQSSDLIDSAGAAPHKTRKTAASSRKSDTRSSSPEKPRVNPIFVFVRQIDTRIVDVKCEDYDKRNRILLTKTAKGWRAIPRTETNFVPAVKEGHHHHKHKKSKKSKRRRSTAVQVDSDLNNSGTEEEENPPVVIEESQKEVGEPSWMEPVNVESLLPSHRICVKRVKEEVEDDVVVVSSDPDECDVNNRETEDNTQTQVKCSDDQISDVSPLDNLLAVAELEWNKDILDNQQQDELDQISEFIEEKGSIFGEIAKREDCDYNDEEDNTAVMDDILTRLEQSLRSPETNIKESPSPSPSSSSSNNNNNNNNNVNVKPVPDSSPFNEQPTDLSLKNPTIAPIADQPTDLSVPKMKPLTPPPPLTIPRPQSQNSEAIQSPQPSGIPAVTPTPEVCSSTNPTKTKPVFLETLLTTTNNPAPEKEPLDLGKCRKSASPTVTCSEEAEPAPKKFKPDDITLKTLLVAEKTEEKPPDTPRLLELLKTDTNEPDPLTQFRQVVTDPSNNIPDPMLIPKEKLSDIITHPGREIPKLLKQRPELRLPDALNFPHLMNDPDILVITQSQVEQIVIRQSEVLCKLTDKEPAKPPPPTTTTTTTAATATKTKTPPTTTTTNKLANDIDAATTAAFNQMMWLPYINQLEAMSFNNNPEFSKMLPMFHAQNMFNNRFPSPLNFPMQPPINFNNPLEMSIWQEAMLQANMLRPKMDNQQPNREYMKRPTKPTNTPKSTPFFPYQNQYLNARHNMQMLPPPLPQQQQQQKSSHYKTKIQQQQQRMGYYPTNRPENKDKLPMDLSGAQLGKLKVKHHLMEAPGKRVKHHHHEDVPEVGSTTASVEEMQDAHKHLWHPLFGNQKGYNNAWNWTSVTATGE